MITDTVDAIAEAAIDRRFCIGLINKQMNATRALVRRACGFEWDAEESAREAVNTRAAHIVAAGLADKEQKPEDEPVMVRMATNIELLRSTLVPLEARRELVEKEMKRLTKTLPVYAWAKDIKGLGELGLAVIVAEAGNISGYPNIRHLWKRLGLAPCEGKAMSNWHGADLTSDEWTQCGYSCRRRAEIFACVQESLFRHQVHCNGPYKAVYDKRRAHTEAARPEWTLGRDGKALKGNGKGHYHDDASRIMVKTLLKDLWVEWHRCEGRKLVADRWAAE